MIKYFVKSASNKAVETGRNFSIIYLLLIIINMFELVFIFYIFRDNKLYTFKQHYQDNGEGETQTDPVYLTKINYFFPDVA